MVPLIGSRIQAFNWCQIGDLEWPWTAQWPSLRIISHWQYGSFRSQVHQSNPL